MPSSLLAEPQPELLSDEALSGDDDSSSSAASSATDADGDKETQASGTEGAQTLAADAVQCGHAPRQPRTAAESGFAFDGFARKVRGVLGAQQGA